jgi:hypothetical protein
MEQPLKTAAQDYWKNNVLIKRKTKINNNW